MKRIKKNTLLKADNKDTFLIHGEFLQKNEVDKMYFSEKIDFQMPKQNECVHYVTNRAFNAFEIVEKILKDEIIEEANITVYSINEKACNKIIEFSNKGLINNITFLFSTIRSDRGTKKSGLETTYRKLEKWGGARIGYYYTHAKVLCLKTKENYYVSEQSCNLSHNSKIEQFCIFNNKELFEFHSKWIASLVKQYKEEQTK